MIRNKFVFVVCGGDEHIETLNYSLPFLKYHSKNEILVVTDSSRNKIAINHDKIIDISTPEQYDNHQASIYLKTGLHKWLEKGHQYCYLDTDIIAISQGVNKVFSHYQQPITFCTDHCRLRQFTLTAVSTPIEWKIKQEHEILNKLFQRLREIERKQLKKKETQVSQIKELIQLFILPPKYLFPLKRKIINGLTLLASLVSFNINAWQFVWTNFFLFLSFKTFFHFVSTIKSFFPIDLERKIYRTFNRKNRLLNYLNKLDLRRKALWLNIQDFHYFFKEHGFKYDAMTTRWYDLRGNFIFEENFVANKIQEETSLRWNPFSKDWTDEDGNVVGHMVSDSLSYLIQQNFGVNITDRNWQHWNGGVFLFDEHSYDFLENWHTWTKTIFEDPNWETRDQGTLIATAWKFGLKNHPTLPIEFNFIADYYHSTLQYHNDFVFDINQNRKNIQPHFLHIYHHFGDKDWKLWQDIEQLREEKIARAFTRSKISDDN